MILVKIEKYHLGGYLEGMDTHETMKFVNWDKACEWAGRVTEKSDVPYVVTKLTNLNTNETQRF